MSDGPSTTSDPTFDETVPHSARVWNYYLGGSHHFAADRLLADQISEMFPGVADIARASRRFLIRVVRYLAGEAGIRQFLDIGAGLPVAENTHEVAQRIAPQSRIVYVDNDSAVVVQARALLTSTQEGATDYIDADVHNPDQIVQGASRTLDFSQPMAIMMFGLLGHVVDYDEARSIAARLAMAMSSGSFLVVNDGTNVIDRAARDAATQASIEAGTPYIARSPEHIAGYFQGLELIEPGVVSCTRWRPDIDSAGGLPDEVDEFCGVARKP